MDRRLLTIKEAIRYQTESCGRVIFSRDALYAFARSHPDKVIRPGNRIYFPRPVLDDLLGGLIPLVKA